MLDFMVPDGWEPVGPGTGQIPGVYDLIQTDGSPPMPFMTLLKTKSKGSSGESADPSGSSSAWDSNWDVGSSSGGGGSSGGGSSDGSGSGGKSKGSGSGDQDGAADGGGQLAIVFRGTNSGPEWMLGELKGGD